MPSVQSEELKTLYKSWMAAFAANPSMELDDMRRMFEHWGDVTAEPGGVDYVEADGRWRAGSVGGAERLCAGPRAALHPRWRLRHRLDVYAPQGVWALGQGDRLPCADRSLPPRPGTRASRTG